jgi:hypothetical protein
MRLSVETPADDGDEAIAGAPLQQVLVGEAGVGDHGSHQIGRRGPRQALQQFQRDLTGRAVLVGRTVPLLPVEPKGQGQTHRASGHTHQQADGRRV